MKLLLSPHNDDAVLFACFTLLREDPLVATVLRSELQESRGRPITAQMREAEDNCAFRELGLTRWEQWPFSDRYLDWAAITAKLYALRSFGFDEVWAPAPYADGGHPHHNELGLLARQVWPDCTLYHTYRNGMGREKGNLVEIQDGYWIRSKLRALACYETQILEPSTGHHFAVALHEWYAA